MDPISLAMGAVGLGMSIFGGFGASSAASAQAKISAQQAQLSGDEATQEQAINDAKQQAMELSGRRQNMETIRNTQKAQAMALASATNQGAQFGSGIQGGLGEIQNQGLFDVSGVNSALETGRTINSRNKNISQDRLQIAALGSQSAQYGSTIATDQGIASLGGAIMKSGPIIGQVSKGFGGFNFNGLFGGGSPSGYGS